ncbi:RBBP9/YdeN family alpha/beta hydrolase [Bartonella ancashensis]|uniref:Putative esterase of the alpha/beta hydrolase fold n=1 Tax=Bartonella ancashensis TaxID=1318743 RepID=A0A0M4LJ01_9HYPH|nr:alpha/beta hydrolase [Bartonella ancashensis]ALE03743.1 putative esterase of the alpha/beta hydrolase fold [Bartonella ancashensis]
MKVNQLDILIIPGYKGSDFDHWQTRWEKKLSTARRIQQHHWSKPICEEWVQEVKKAIATAHKPVVIIAHSLGVPTAICAIAHDAKKICGAFFVAPPDVTNEKIRPKHLMTFGPYQRNKLPFPSTVVASRNDDFCQFSVAKELASDWGSLFIDAGFSGHINTESGHGPWPEGLIAFSRLLSKI